jgi:hypothetical protein
MLVELAQLPERSQLGMGVSQGAWHGRSKLAMEYEAAYHAD